MLMEVPATILPNTRKIYLLMVAMVTLVVELNPLKMTDLKILCQLQLETEPKEQDLVVQEATVDLDLHLDLEMVLEITEDLEKEIMETLAMV